MVSNELDDESYTLGTLNIVFAAQQKVLIAQLALTFVGAVMAAILVGSGTAMGVVAGGVVVVLSSLAFGAAFYWRSFRDAGDPGRALRTMLFAEAVKWMIAIGGLFWLLKAEPFAISAGPVVAGFVVALTGSWFALLTKT